MYGLRLFIVVLQKTILFTKLFTYLYDQLEVAIMSPSFVALHFPVSEIAKLYSLRLFIVVLQELYCLPNCLHVCMIRVKGCYHFTKFCYSTPGF